MKAFTEEEMKHFSMARQYDLAGRVAVVTGGATGLGLAITRCMVAAGARVAALGSRPAEAAMPSLEAFGDRVKYYQYDVTRTDEAQAMADRIIADMGHVDILVNNAGNHCKKYVWDMTVEDYESVLDVHLVGAFALTKAFVPHMKQNGFGRLIFQASMTSYIGQPMVAGYTTAKAGILGLIHALTADLAEYGITANAIAPGWIDTPMFHKATDTDPQRLNKILGRIPAKTVGDPMDVGMCAAFLASDAARYISGACIPVDGGALIGF
ncbi:MAG: SDR family oxidoreductase [Clostridia bacterium]|nr:SDR family oxidoreductase [Clostridia bacterium]